MTDKLQEPVNIEQNRIIKIFSVTTIGINP